MAAIAFAGMAATSFSPLRLNMPAAMADDDGGTSSGDHGEGGDGHGGEGDGGSANSGPGSADDHSGPGGGDTGDADGDEDAGGAMGGEHGGGVDFVADEVVVANLGDGARADVSRLGFVILDERKLASLGLTVTRLRIPRHLTAPAARTLLAARFPGVLVDLNALYRQQGQIVLPAPDYAANLIGWGHASAGCGENLRIGVLDTAVDTAAPALRRARIVQRSFLSEGMAPASSAHGTAIATILVGSDATGGISGLLPAAELAVAAVFAADPAGEPIGDVVAIVDGLDWLAATEIPVVNMSSRAFPTPCSRWHCSAWP
jgi:hypothetical protein